MFSDSFVIKYKVEFCDSCTHTHFSVTHTLPRCDCYTRHSFAWMLESCILPTLITNFWTKNCVLWIVDGSKKLSGNIWLFMGYINRIQCFKMSRKSFVRIKLILKFHKDCNFPGRFLIHLIYFSCLYFCYHFW